MDDFDKFDAVFSKTTADLDKLLAQLDDCDLGDWDRSFVDDLVKRLERYGNNITISGRQWEQLERLKGQYLWA